MQVVQRVLEGCRVDAANRPHLFQDWCPPVNLYLLGVPLTMRCSSATPVGMTPVMGETTLVEALRDVVSDDFDVHFDSNKDVLRP